MKRKIYVASSWRNLIQPHIVTTLRHMGHEVYDFRNPRPATAGFGWRQVGDFTTPETYLRNIYHERCLQGFMFDKDALDWCDTCVLVLPCGRSAHIEAGYAIGQGKSTFILLSEDGFEPELMYLLANGMFNIPAELFEAIGRL